MGTDLTDRKWIIVRIDGKIAAISTDYRQLAKISTHIANMTSGQSRGKDNSSRKKIRSEIPFNEISATVASYEQICILRQSTEWDDLMLLGTDFQKKVWRKLWELGKNMREVRSSQDIGLVSYSDFAELCQNRAGVRAVAHAIGLNPVAIIIPCHLVVPKESIDRIREIKKKAEATIFKGDDLCISSILNDNSIDFGEYSYGRTLKRKLIIKELTGFSSSDSM